MPLGLSVYKRVIIKRQCAFCFSNNKCRVAVICDIGDTPKKRDITKKNSGSFRRFITILFDFG